MLQVNVSFDIIAIVEKLKPSTTEKPTLSIEYLDTQIEKLLDPKITKEEWKTKWRNPDFTELFPNLTFRLVSLKGSNKYTPEQRQTIFESGFASFTELLWIERGIAGVTMMKVNEKSQLWEQVPIRQIEQYREYVIRVGIGCFILLGLSLKDKEDAIKLIIGTYNNVKKTVNQQGTFRTNIMLLTAPKNAFRQWVKANDLDRNNGFEWDSKVTRLGLKLVPQNKFPTELQDLKNYSPQAIAEAADYILEIATGTITNIMRSHINIFQTDLAARLKSADFDDYPELRDELQQKLNQSNSLVRQ